MLGEGGDGGTRGAVDGMGRGIGGGGKSVDCIDGELGKGG